MVRFRRRRRTMDTIMDLVTLAEHERQCGNITLAVFLDVKRAFDKASHIYVLHDLLQLGISGRCMRWIADFPKGRTVFINTADGKSKECKVTRCSARKCPFLFNCFMSQLHCVLPVSLNYSIYANDMCIWISSSSIHVIKQHLQQSLDAVSEIFISRGMSLTWKNCCSPIHTKTPEKALSIAKSKTYKTCSATQVLRWGAWPRTNMDRLCRIHGTEH